MPVYIREIKSDGLQVYKPDHVQTVEFTYDLPATESHWGFYSSGIIVSDHGVKLLNTNGKTHELNKPAKFYLDEGMHHVVMGAYDFKGDYLLKGTGLNTLHLDSSNTAHIQINGPSGINPTSNGINQGSFDDDMAEVSFQPLATVNQLTSSTILNAGMNRSDLKADNYRISFARSIRKYNQENEVIMTKYLRLYRDIDIKAGQAYNFEFGGPLHVDVQYDYTDALSGYLNIQDHYGNTLISNEREYFYQFGRPTVEEMAVRSSDAVRTALFKPLEEPVSSFTFDNPVMVLQRQSTQQEYRASIDGHNRFKFISPIPDGDYWLYAEELFDSDFLKEYPLTNNRIPVTVINGQFAHPLTANHPPKAANRAWSRKVLQYDRVVIDLNTLFADADKDKLYYEASDGYILDDTFYYNAESTGIYPILITASDRIGGRTQARFDLTVWDGELEINPADEIRVFVNGRLQTFDQPPLIDHERTLVPLRTIFTALGAQIEWDEATQTVTAKQGDAEIRLTVGNSQAIVNGKAVNLEVPAKIVQSRTLVPARFIGEALGAEVEWDPVLKTVYIRQ